MKRTRLPTRVVLVLVYVCSDIVHAASKDVKGAYFNENMWTLVESEDESVHTLSDLRDGVYSLELAATRSGCQPSGPGTSGVMSLLSFLLHHLLFH